MEYCATTGQESQESSESMPPPITVLRILTRLNIGGPSRHAALLFMGLDPSRFATCLVVGRPSAAEGDCTSQVRHASGGQGNGRGSHMVQLAALGRSIRPWADVVALAQLLRLLWREHPRIIHTHMAKAGALGRLGGLLYNAVGPGRSRGARAYLVHTFHGHVLSEYFPAWLSRIFLWIEQWLARRTDCLIAVSQAIRDDLLAKHVGHLAQWRVIPLGLDLSDLSTLPPPERGSAFRIGLVGRLVPIKNPELFLVAVGRVRERLPQAGVRGLVVGDGPLRRQLEAKAKAMGLDGHVEFTGWRRDLRACYEGLDAVCLTSWNEGTPLALIEAMAAGRPILATDVGGVRDVLGETGHRPSALSPGAFQVTERGVLVPPGDAKALAEAMGAVSQDAALRHQLGQAARAYVVQHFSQERLLRDITALYEGLLIDT